MINGVVFLSCVAINTQLQNIQQHKHTQIRNIL